MIFLWFTSPMVFSLLALSHSQKCLESSQGTAFLHHSYNTFITQDPFHCYGQCLSDVSCQSFNYHRTSGKCELNSRTVALAGPRDLQMNDDVIYMDNPSRVSIGSSIHVPAKSCDEIKKINNNFVSGLYWVMSKLGPEQKYCEEMRSAPRYCHTYINITDATRNTKYLNINDTCDKYLSKKWYRFTGPAGVRMPSSCVPTNRCNTDAPGWLSEPHPTFEEGLVKRKVCFHWKSNCCLWNSTIRVANCGEFFMYELVPPCCCNLRYCGSSD